MRLTFAEINFRMDLFSRMPRSKTFGWIYFRGWSNFGNFAWSNFHGRQNLYLKKRFFLFVLN